MLAEAIDKIIGLSEVKTKEINGSMYADRLLHRISNEITATAIPLNTLSGLIDYIKNNTHELRKNMIIVVGSATHVELWSELNSDRRRESLIDVKASVPGIDFDSWMDAERFNIMLQSQFVKNADKELLLKFAGNVKAGTVNEYGDDGVSQKAVIKTGVANLDEALVPNPVMLKPFRTFPEIEQPESGFIFRMRNGARENVECALYEADGGAWKLTAIQSIKTFLEDQLKGVKGISVLA